MLRIANAQHVMQDLLLVCQAQVAQHVNNFIHSVRSSSGAGFPAFFSKPRSTAFLSASEPVLASGLPLTTNVRVMAAEQSFHTVASMVEDLVYSC